MLLGFACVSGAAPAPAPFKLLHSFAGSPNDGAMPTYGTSLAAAGGTLYGVTQSGGTSSNGVLFKINSDGSGYSVLHVFNGYTLFLNPGGAKNDGAIPTGTPVISGSTLYGMTTQGGSNGFGTVYRINTDGSGFQVLHDFTSIANDGYLPQGSLVLSGSTLYGMAESGGNNSSQGAVFRMETDGSGYQILHYFTPGQNDDGGDAIGSLAISGSALYGMTRLAGTFGQGVLFRMNTDGSGYQILRQFTGVATDAALPYGSLSLDGSTLYGTSSAGGANNAGTVFKINTDGGGFQILHSFALSEGWQPNGDVTVAGPKLYGMTRSGGSNFIGGGVLFQMNTDGSGYEILHLFRFPVTQSDGLFPFGSVLFSDGSLYGMTSLGGGHKNQGCVFSYKLGSGGTGTGTPALGGAFSKIKEACKTRRGVLSCAFSAALTVQNTGTATSVPNHLRYFFSSDNLFDASVDVQFGTKALPKIKAGKSKKLMLKTKTTESTAGRYLLAVDDAGAVLASTLLGAQ